MRSIFLFLLFGLPIITYSQSEIITEYNPINDSLKELIRKNPCIYIGCSDVVLCPEIEKDGDYVCYGNTGIAVKAVIKNGKLNGPYVGYNTDGNIKIKGIKVDGKFDGTVEYFFNSGKFQSLVEYKMGAIWNLKEMRDILGKKLNPGTLKNGSGSLNFYRLDGSLLRTVNLLDGKANGKCEYFFPNGKVMMEGIFLNNHLHGIWKEYDMNGKLLRQVHYINGKRMK